MISQQKPTLGLTQSVLDDPDLAAYVNDEDIFGHQQQKSLSRTQKVHKSAKFQMDQQERREESKNNQTRVANAAQQLAADIELIEDAEDRIKRKIRRAKLNVMLAKQKIATRLEDKN